jgi:hypothetical protein
LLHRGKGLEKLSVFEFLDAQRRSGKVILTELKGWPKMEAATANFLKQKFYGLYWDSRGRVWEIKGLFGDFLTWLETVRADCWLIFEDTREAFVTTHERQYAMMTG